MTVVDKESLSSMACAAALAAFPAMTPARLAALLDKRTPVEVWSQLVRGAAPSQRVAQLLQSSKRDLWTAWCNRARSTNPSAILECNRKAGVGVWSVHDSYPARLADDEHRPAVLFWRGNKDALERPTVAIIGTRNCTHEGRLLAYRFGVELAEAGVAVVSGLALGIDGAAHEGALKAAFGANPIGVVGSGLDVVYPRRHVKLWNEVAKRGLLMSESALGAQPEAWRFPSRNRIIAALADVVVVVESHDRGGSLLTVEEAVQRGVPVMTVPGSIVSAASKGTNKLLSEGAIPVCSTQDIFDEMRWSQDFSRREINQVKPLDADLPVFRAISSNPTGIDEIMLRTSLPLGDVSLSLKRLELAGLVISDQGWWCKAVG